MKSTVATLLISFFFLLPFISCSNSTKSDSHTIERVQNLKAVQTLEKDEIKLSWTNPNDDDLVSVEITYKPFDGSGSLSTLVIEAKKGATVTYIIKVSAYTEYAIAVAAISKSGQRSLPLGIRAAPLGPEIVISNNVSLADPYILYHNGTYYAYGTNAADGIEVYTSATLRSWKKHSTLALHKNNSYGDKWFWAPEVYYRESNKTFYMYYSAEEHICVATSSSPLGPFVQKDQKAMREEKSIDSSLFIDDNGTPYLYFVRFTDGNVIWVAQLEDDLMTIKESTIKECIKVSQDWEKNLGRVVEGPSVVKRNGVYYLIYSGNDYQSQNYGVGYATSNSPTGTWTKSNDNPIFQKPEATLVGVGHGALFFDKNGDSKYVFHAHNSTNGIHPRLMYITDMAIEGGKVSISKNDIIRPYVIK